MITANNYFEEVERIGVNTLPETLRKGHDLVVRSTSNGANWSNYQSSDSIKKVIDLYLQKLNEYAGTLAPKNVADKNEAKPKRASSKPSDRIPKPKKTKEANEPKNVKQVEHIREEVKFIKRYVATQ